MEKTKLEMDFLDSLEKVTKIILDDPKMDLTPSEIEVAMNSIISNNVFVSKNGDFVGVGGARVVTTNTNEIEF